MGAFTTLGINLASTAYGGKYELNACATAQLD